MRIFQYYLLIMRLNDFPYETRSDQYHSYFINKVINHPFYSIS